MAFDAVYRDEAPQREDVDQSRGWLLLEFGANWCGHCLSLSPDVEAVLKAFPQVQHLRVADGPGRRLGRSFRVKLWPTLILLHDGKVMAELIRPTGSEVQEAFERLMNA